MTIGQAAEVSVPLLDLQAQYRPIRDDILQAIVRVRPLPGRLHEVERLIQSIPEFTECDKVTGEDCFIARLHVRSMEQLDELLDRINAYAESNTAIVKKTSVARRLPPMSGAS